MESQQHAIDIAGQLKEICQTMKIGLVYKSSFDKANRTNIKSHRGIGLEKAKDIFKEINTKMNIPTITDIHNEQQAKEISEVVDIIQIPAFLCRQTDLLIAAAKTGKIINVKKGQFLAPNDMKNVVEKISQNGNQNIMITERGTCFGYNNLVSDFRALPIMAKLGTPIIFDATHSVQKPAAQGNKSGGDREFVEILAKAAVAVGVAGVFMETHQDPDNAPSDGPNMINIKDISNIIEKLIKIDQITKSA